MTDQDIQQFQAGDKAAIKKLYDDYSGALYNTALKIVNDSDMAQDVLQDAFMKIWRSRTTYDAQKGRIFTWMMRIVHNTALDLLGRKDVRHEIQMDDNTVYTNESVVDGNVAIDASDLRNQVIRLKPEHQQVIDVVYFLGHTHEEAAEKLKIPLGTLKTRVRLALRDLKQLFETSK